MNIGMINASVVLGCRFDHKQVYIVDCMFHGRGQGQKCFPVRGICTTVYIYHMAMKMIRYNQALPNSDKKISSLSA